MKIYKPELANWSSEETWTDKKNNVPLTYETITVYTPTYNRAFSPSRYELAKPGTVKILKWLDN
jgi:hypothetical protein